MKSAHESQTMRELTNEELGFVSGGSLLGGVREGLADLSEGLKDIAGAAGGVLGRLYKLLGL
jgi:hypothetical protein